jgi:hypothetical protein
MRPILERFSADRGSLNRSSPVTFSSSRRNSLKQFYTDWLSVVRGMNFESMSQDGKIDYILFENLVEYELRQLDLQAKNLAEIAPLLPFAQTIIELEESRRRMETLDSRKAAGIRSKKPSRKHQGAVWHGRGEAE